MFDDAPWVTPSPVKVTLPAVAVTLKLPRISAPLPVAISTDVAVTLPVSAIPAVWPTAFTVRLLPTSKSPSVSILLTDEVMEIELADDTVKLAMSILSVWFQTSTWERAPEIVSEAARPTETFAAVAFVATTLVIDLNNLVEVTLVADAPETVSDWGLPLASVPVMTKLLEASLPVNVNFRAWLVRKRSPLCNNVRAPPAATLCAGAMATGESTMPTCRVPRPKVPLLILTVERLTAPASVMRTAAVPFVSASVVDSSAYWVIVLPPPNIRILPVPAL